MSYAVFSVIAGEQPTTAKWNLLGSNDAAFNNGTGFAANAILSPALGLAAAFDATNGVKSQANAGTAGGTMYYINLGGIKLLWMISAFISTNVTPTNVTITFPTSFFSTIQSTNVSVFNLTAQQSQFSSGQGFTATSGDINLWANSAATTQASLFVIGT